MERNRKRKNGATKEYISIQSTVNVTVSSQAEKKSWVYRQVYVQSRLYCKKW